MTHAPTARGLCSFAHDVSSIPDVRESAFPFVRRHSVGPAYFAWALLIAATTGGCVNTATPGPASVPELPERADAETKRSFYARYALTREGNRWKRGEEKYDWPALADVSKQFPETRAVYDHAQTRAVLINLDAGLAGGLIGATLGWNLSASDATRMSGDTQVALYSVGGGLAVLAVVLALAWHNPTEDFAETYNRILRERLGLPAPSDQTVQGSSSGVRPTVSDGSGWRF